MPERKYGLVIEFIFLAPVYERTGSVLFTSILHGIFGNIVFTIGLGEFFWLDMYKLIAQDHTGPIHTCLTFLKAPGA